MRNLSCALGRRCVLMAVLASALAAATAPAVAADITAIASMALRDSYVELVPAYEKASGNKVTMIWSPAVNVPKRVEAGEKADLAILPAAGVDDLIKKGFLAEGSRVALARSSIGVAVPHGRPRPDLTSGEALKKSLLAAKTVVLSGGTSSFYLKALFQKMGIDKQLEPKLKQYGPGGGDSVNTVLARGDGDIGFQQVSEFLNVPGVDYVGPLPPDIQEVTVFSSGLYRSAKEPMAARSLIEFLTSAEAARILRKHGLEPG